MSSLKDLARECGVSVATVSKALNGQSDISAATRDRVREAARRMGYVPNMAARAMKTNRTYNLGVLFVDERQSGLAHEYFSAVLDSFKVQVEKLGYDITFVNRNLGGRTMTYLEHCHYRGVDGAVIACVDFNDPQVVELVNSDVPVVTIDHVFNNRMAVLSDNVNGLSALVLLSFLCLFFFYVLVINSTRTHFEIQKGFSFLPGKSLMTNLKNVLSDANIPVLTGVRNSLIVSGCSAALSVYFSALTAYGIYAYNFRFKKAAFAIILLIMTMPTQVSALGFLQLITKMGLKNSFIPLIIPSIAAPAVFFFMKQYLDASLPMEIVEAARIDGAGEFYTFNHIVLPIMKPALAVQAIFSFVSSWNNYFIPALVLDTADKKTLPILIAQLRSADFLKFDMGKVYMLVAIAILPVIIVYLLLSKFIVRGVALGGVKG